MRKPSSTPTTMARPKPAMVTQKVRQAWPMMVTLCSSVCSQMREGLGKMNSETPKPEVMTSQITMIPISSSSGEKRSMFLRRLAFMVCSLLDGRARLAKGADVTAQFVHDVAEVLAVGDFEVTRARDRDLAAH